MAASNYINTFGEPASNNDLDHIFDVLNENNDDRIQYREFVKHTENAGFKASKEDLRAVFDHICTLSDDKVINKKAWIGGIEIAHQNPLTQECYTKILCGGQYDPQPGRSEMNIDDITKTLKDIKADWRHRMNCMESLCRQLTTKNMTTDKFHSIFRLNHVGLTKQARDRRSNVMRVACECEAKLIRRWKREFSKYGATLIEYIYELVRVKIKINNMMGKNVLICLVKNCPDSKKLRFLELLGKEANESKYQNLKKDCFDVLVVYFHHQTESLKDEDVFWELLMKITKKGVEDVDQIRNAAMNLLAAIQVERHDLAFPIIKNMNDHLRKRYESEYQISRGSNRGSPSKKKVNKIRGAEYKQDGGDYVSLPGTDSHARKHTWSTNDLIAGFAQMQQKRLSNVSIAKKKKEKAKDRTKVKAKFPVPPDGQYFSPFGESVTEQDILYAFEFVDVRNDHQITIDEMQIVCDKLDIDKAEKLFNYLDVDENDAVTFDNWKQALSLKSNKLKEFWHKVLGGKALEESPKSDDYDLDDANKILSNQGNDLNARILALHSITRKMCMKLSEDKFHKQFKKCIGNITSHLFDRKAYVMREACICLGKIMIARRAQFVKFAVRTLEALYEIIKINDDKRHFSAHQAAKVLIRFIPDSKKFPIFAIVTKGCTEKAFSLTRNSSFEYVNHILARMVQVDQSRNDRFWAYMDKILESGLNDSDQNVRDSAYSALAKTEVLRKDLAVEYIKTLRKAAKDKYIGIKKHVLQNIQDEDFGAEGPGLLIALGHSTSSLSVGSEPDLSSPTPTRKSTKSAKSPIGGVKSPKKLKAAITSDSRFTMTPMGFAELGAQYNANKQSRKSSQQLGSKQKKGSRSPATNRERMKNRSATVGVSEKKSRRTASNSSNGSNSGSKKKKKALTTDDYTPQRGRDRANSKRRQNRPKTARISKDKEKERSQKKGRTNSGMLTKKKKKKEQKREEGVREILESMSMADQARQALCITAHKALVQAFIEKTENLAGTINFLQFRECLNSLGLDVGKGNALAAFSELDEDKMDRLDMEEFGHAVHVAFPQYDKLWKQLTRSKYRYYATLEPLMQIEEIRAILGDKKLGWKLKTRAMRSACTICCDQKRSDIEITQIVKKLIDSLIVCLRSNNQLVVREACICIATMAKERNVCLKGVVGKLLKTCWELLDVKNELIKFSAAQCLKIVIKYVPDDQDNKYLKTLIQGTNLSDFGSVRQSCFECIIVMILRAGNPNNLVGFGVGNNFWKRIQKVIIDGVQSDEQEVKEYAFHCLYAFERSAPQKAQYLTEQFDDDILREYNIATNTRPLLFSDTDSIKSDLMSPDPINIAEDDEKEIPQNNQPPHIIEDELELPDEAPTPVPSNEALPSSLEERTKQIEEIYNKCDDDGSGTLNRFKAMKFLKELMNVNMRNAEIILSGLDLQNADGQRGQFSKQMLQNWAYFHSPEMEPNPLLHEEAESMQWLTLRRDGLEKRKALYSKLLALEKTDKNYAIVYDLDSKICILNYLIRQC